MLIVKEVDGAIEPELGADAEEAARREELIADAVELDGIVVGDFTRDLDTEDLVELLGSRSRSPGGSGVSGWEREALGIARDEGVIEEASGAGAIGEGAVDEFIDEAALKAAVKTFAAAARLRAMGEDQTNVEGLHGALEVSELLSGLADLDAVMARGFELTAAIEIEGLR